MAIELKTSDLDFSPLHAVLQQYVDSGVIPFANSVVMQGTDVVDLHFYGNTPLESGKPLAEDSIFRMHSSTKLACSIALMRLWEAGSFKLEDRLEDYIPAFAAVQVLKEGATEIDSATLRILNAEIQPLPQNSCCLVPTSKKFLTLSPKSGSNSSISVEPLVQ